MRIPPLKSAYAAIQERIRHAASPHPVNLIAVSKTRPATEIRSLAELGQRAFGENYVQEALAKQSKLSDLPLEWHFIGPLQSNKCREVAAHFDWLQSLDREKLVEPLNRYRQVRVSPLMVLIEVNIDGEPNKAGCSPTAAIDLAKKIAAAPNLILRGLMAIPEPYPDQSRRRESFRQMRELYGEMQRRHPQIDTLSLGMSDDFELAISEGATMVRIGSALFGPRV